MSEKLDGCRCFWDGGASRKMLAEWVPYANIEKDARYNRRIIATGLWSRYGKVIHAPDWWLDLLPRGIPLDGELYMGVGKFQTLMSTVKELDPGPGWKNVEFRVFDSPPLSRVFAPGRIENTNFRKSFDERTLEWIKDKVGIIIKADRSFESIYHYLTNNVNQNDVVVIHEQEQLPFNGPETESRITERLLDVCSQGGEGLVLRRHVSIWKPERTWDCLKVKQVLDAEGTVVGYVWGKETDKGSKLLGLMGSVILDFNSRQFELSGFTEEERVMDYVDQSNGPELKRLEMARRYGTNHSGELIDGDFHNPKFPRGSKVTFKYRELTDGLIPKEARYFRKR